VTRPISPGGRTIRDECGRVLVVERFEDGRVGSWIADIGENDGVSVLLTEDDLRRITAFLLGGLA
jgi:hypothetical protein